jgi:glutaredoxin-related protein
LTSTLVKLQAIVSSLKKLEVFAFEGIKVIKNFPMLKELNFQNDVSLVLHVLCSFAHLDNSRLEVLELKDAYDVLSDVLADIAQSAPNLKKFIVESVRDFEMVFSFMKSFRTIESLTFEHLENAEDKQVFLEDEGKNVHLKSLRFNVWAAYTFQHVKKLIEIFPNLKHLELFLGVQDRSMLPD